MPEGVEVKLITEKVNALVQDKFLINIEILGGRFQKGLIGFDTIPPIQIKEVNCKGKFIYWILDKDWYIWNTLGMTGTWQTQPDKHACLRFFLDDGSNLYFSDIRHFGTLKFVQGTQELKKKLRSLGPDLLNEQITPEAFHQKLKYSVVTLAEFLMNQKNFSGIGNYIKAEALYRAKLSPWKKAHLLSFEEAENLLKEIQAVMQTSYQHQGATLSTYKNVDGKSGEFAKFLQIYKKDKDPLNNEIVSELTLDNRTTYWVPSLQK